MQPKRARDKRERYEVIFALPVLLPFPDDYGVTQYAGEGGPIVTALRFRWGEAEDSRQFRHRVVHEGVVSSLAAAIAAARSAEALSERIDDAVVERVERYPRTAARKLGPALLDRVPEDEALAAIIAAETMSPIKVGVIQEE